MDVPPQDVVFQIDIAPNIFKNLSPYVREFLISEEVQFPPRPPTETNHNKNQWLLLVINASVEA